MKHSELLSIIKEELLLLENNKLILDDNNILFYFDSTKKGMNMQVGASAGYIEYDEIDQLIEYLNHIKY
jgi:hypothetical protein